MDVSNEDADNVTEEVVESRIYTVAELKTMKPGAVFMHPTLGKGIVRKHESGTYLYMEWKDQSKQPAAFHVDSIPWNEPMIRLN